MLSEFGSMFFASNISSEFAGWIQDLGLEASGHGTALGLVALRDEDLRRDVPTNHSIAYRYFSRRS
jgi:non-heme chloroperoxidase